MHAGLTAGRNLEIRMKIRLRTFALSLIAAFSAMFAMALVFHGLFLGDYIAENVDPALRRDSPGYCCIVLGYAALAVLMSWLYPHYRTDALAPWKRGLGFGVVVGLLWIFPVSLVLHGAYRFPFSLVLIDAGWAVVEQGVGGIVVAAVYSRLDAKSGVSENVDYPDSGRPA
jgi:hypothetical protein